MKKSNDKDRLGFIDRDAIRNIIESSCNQLLRDITFFKIISICGVGGIGKTELLQEEFLRNCSTLAKPVFITLEITNKDDLLDILIKFRKALPSTHKYPLFDYAMLYTWNHLNTSKMDTDFLMSTKRNVIDFFRPILDIAIGPPSDLSIGSIIETVCSCSDYLLTLCQNIKIKKTIARITEMRFHDLLTELPIILGADIHRAFLEEHFLLVIDSYKEYSDNNSFSWLTSLIEEINYGVHIITSREEINWPQTILSNVKCVHLNELPVSEVERELNIKFGYKPALIQNIIQVTGCMPIYLDLAVRTLAMSSMEEINIGDIFFKSREDIINKFLLHLSCNERNMMIVLAIIQIFDVHIFEYLVKDLNMQVDILCFDDICKRSIIRNYERDSYFYKTHDVISENVIFISEKAKVHRIIRSYLNFLHEYGSCHYSNIQLNMLLKHIISIYIKTELSLSQKESEQLLDLYFVIKESMIPFECDRIDGFETSDNMRDMFYFLCALSKERADSKVRLAWLSKINESSCLFGKHLASFKLMKGYLLALCEGTYHLRDTVLEINACLKNTDVQEWYFGQTKIFLGDCLVSYGRYQSGINELEGYRKLLVNLIGKENDVFQVSRHIGHAYRFNMMLDEAADEYGKLIYGNNVFPTPLKKVYILTNLCETYCYFRPEKVFEIANEAITLSNTFCDLKSKAKIYYSLAIALLHKRKYKRARKFVRKSLYLNQKDGYLAGKLYAYMAQIYYEYACNKQLNPLTIIMIKKLQKITQVYSCFNLPIAIMLEDYNKIPQIKDSQEWLDFYNTAIAYRKFIDSLR